MFELDRELAQDIVDRAMAILPCNVNVMDSQGLILASGEPSRIDSRHEGAQLVLSNRRVVEIDSQSALCLRGVQPGINLALMHDGQLVGVLGLTGEPQALRTYAQLLCMTAEMLVSQKYRESQRQWRNQRSEDVLALLLDEEGDSARLFDEALQLGLNPELERLPIILEFETAACAPAIRDWLAARVPGSWCVVLSAQSLIWCCPVRHSVDPQTYLERFDAKGWQTRRMAVGTAAHSLPALRKVLASVKALVAYGRAVLPNERVLLLARYQVATILWAHREDHAVDALLSIIEKVRSRDINGQLMETLRCWCRLSGQMQQCADALGLHRNTLRYRMDKVAEITGMDLANLDDVLALYLAVQLLPREFLDE